ncbi:MAG: DUF3857 domain-containing protein [Cyclobacteriaceae bacterium]
MKNTFIKSTLILLFIGAATIVKSQQYEPYEWDVDRTLMELSDDEAAYPLYYLKKAEIHQYEYDASKRLMCYITNHQIIKVNNDEALSRSNQIYIPMYNTIELVAIKARAITKDGSIVNFDKSNIKELEGDKSGYKIFAIEGAEVGGEIEYFYTRKTYSSNFFTNFFQFTYPVKSYDFSLKCPENLEYDFKIYNYDQGQVAQTDTTKDFNLYQFSASQIADLQSESFGAYENSKMRMEAKLAYNSESGSGRKFTWGDAGIRIYPRIYELTKSEKKAFSKLTKQLDLSGNPLDAFRKAEHAIKTTYFLQEDAGDEGYLLDAVIQNKYATSFGFTKLYAALLNHLDIEHEIVLTSNRMKRAFDPDFDTWNYLDEYLIYVNKADQFLSPKDTPFRLGTIPSDYINSYGLFIKQEKIQDFTHPVSRTAFIPPLSYTANFDNMDLSVSFSEDLDENIVTVERAFKGYGAEYYKAATLFLQEEQKKEMLDNVVKYLANDANIESVNIKESNTGYDEWHAPFVVEGKFETKSYIESAGDIILFKVGEMIGAQSELYQERERNTPIANDFNRGYLRKIRVEIPDGYVVKNPDDIIINEQVVEDRLIYDFESSYTINEQTLDIEIVEFYDQIDYPVEKFEPFRKVINAAADWNKIVLVIEED